MSAVAPASTPRRRAELILLASRMTHGARLVDPETDVYFRPMTVGFVPAFEPRIDATFDGDGAALFHHAAALDMLAEERGLPLLTAFADNREPPPDFDGMPEELVEAIGPWTAWFSSTEGLRCVEGLLEALEEPSARAKISFVATVIDDLAALRDVLAVAKKRRARFRLEVA